MRSKQRGVGSKSRRPVFGYWAFLPLCLGIITVIFGGYDLIERRWLVDVDMEIIHLFHLLRGILSSLVVAIATAWLLLKRVVPAFPPEQEAAESILDASQTTERLRWQAAWLIQMRWLAVLVAAALIVLSGPLMHMLPKETIPPLMAVVALLALANLLLHARSTSIQRPASWILGQIILDLVLLTALLHYSGGLENPLHAVYLFHIIIAGVVLSRKSTYAVTLFASVCLALLGAAELLDWVEHYTITIFPHHGGGQGAEYAVEHAAHDPLFVTTKTLTFVGILALTAYFTTLIVAELRRREVQLVVAAREAMNEHEKLVTAVDAAGAGMVLLSPDYTIRWVSKRMSEWFGMHAGHLHLDCSSTPWGSNGGCEDCPSRAAVLNRRIEEKERAVVTPEGKKLVFQITSSPLIGERGEIREIVELVQDVTERKAVEAELAHAGKMAALGKLAAGIAHEIGNPLSSLSTRLQLLEERQDPGFVRDSIGLIQRQIGRIARIVHGISGFSRTGSGEWGMLDVNACVAEIVNLLRTDRRASGIEIRTDLDDKLPPTLAVKDEILQVFLNVCINAFESMHDGGTLEISSRRAGDEIRLAFRDSGEGMPDEVRAQLFAPFFTTKPDGTGLGLSLSYQILQAHGGGITVESHPGVGSTFRIHLPIRSSRRHGPAAVSPDLGAVGTADEGVVEDAGEKGTP